MKMPSTSAPQYFYIDPSKKFVNFNQSTYPALKVQSIVNLANERAVIQLNSALQPTWSDNAIAGQYVATNNPGTNNLRPAGIPGLTFTGAQILAQDNVASQFFNVASSSFAIVCQVACSPQAGGAIAVVSETSGSNTISLLYSSGTIQFTDGSELGAGELSATMDNNVHVIVAIRANNALTLRIDGVQVATAATIPNSVPYNTFSIGAANMNGSTQYQFTGVIGKLAVYGGNNLTSMPDVDLVETYMLLDAGIIRSASQGRNLGF